MAETETPTESSHHSMISTATVVKIVIIAVIIYIAYSIIRSFQFDKIPGLKNLADAFNNLTGAAAYASGHWYLLGALLILGAFLPAAYKWAANKAGEGIKSNMDPDAFAAYTDAIIIDRMNELKSQTTDPTKIAEYEKTASEAQDRWDSHSDEAREEATTEANKNDVAVPEKSR